MNKIDAKIALEMSCLKDVCIAEGAEIMPKLIAMAREVRLDPQFEGDYKDEIAQMSARLSWNLWTCEQQQETSAMRRFYARVKAEASRRGLLNGYDCPRATHQAWQELLRDYE